MSRANEHSDGPVRRMLLVLLKAGHTLLISGEMICTLDRDFYAAETVSFYSTLGIEIRSDRELSRLIDPQV